MRIVSTLSESHCWCNIFLILSLRFNSHFPGEPWLAGVYWSKGWWRWWWQLDYWSYKSCKAPVKSSPANQHPIFLQAGCPSCRPTNSVKALKGKISHSMDLLTPNSPGVFQLCLWPLVAPGYLGGGLPCFSSALWCQYRCNYRNRCVTTMHSTKLHFTYLLCIMALSLLKCH